MIISLIYGNCNDPMPNQKLAEREKMNQNAKNFSALNVSNNCCFE